MVCSHEWTLSPPRPILWGRGFTVTVVSLTLMELYSKSYDIVRLVHSHDCIDLHDIVLYHSHHNISNWHTFIISTHSLVLPRPIALANYFLYYNYCTRVDPPALRIKIFIYAFCALSVHCHMQEDPPWYNNYNTKNNLLMLLAGEAPKSVWKL